MDAPGVSRPRPPGGRPASSVSIREWKTGHQGHTSLTFWGSPFECVRTRLIRTFDPLNVPSYTHPRSESESVHVFGRTLLTPHILRSSSSGSRNGTLLGSEISQRACPGGERRTERNDAETHLIQIVDEPSQVLALQTRSSIFVFVPAEEVSELVVEIKRSSVELAELLQEIGRGHGAAQEGPRG